jgi:hypothetical protein
VLDTSLIAPAILRAGGQAAGLTGWTLRKVENDEAWMVDPYGNS